MSLSSDRKWENGFMEKTADINQEASSVNEAVESALTHSQTGERATHGVTKRVVVFSLLLACLFGYIIPIIDHKLSNTYLGAAHLPPGAIAVMLMLLLVINPLLQRAQAGGFSRNELLTIYITCLFSCLVPGHGAENFFVPNLIAPFYYAATANQSLGFLVPYLKPWFTPALANGSYDAAGKAVVEGWFAGTPTGAIPWGAWIAPLLAWGIFIFASYFMLGCLSVILRAQWAERDKLTFPLLALPLAMTEDTDLPNVVRADVIPRFLRNPRMWVGFDIAIAWQSLNSIGVYFPGWPQIPTLIPTGQLIGGQTGSTIGELSVGVYPLVVGITYLLASKVSFSLWFFYWFFRLQLIIATFLGYQPKDLTGAIGHTGYGIRAFTAYQQVGAFFAFAAILLWFARKHLAHVVRRAFGRTGATPEEAAEPLSYPVAFWGFVLAFGFIVAWSVAAGMRLDVALLMWLSYIVIAIVLTRVVIEGGLLFVQQNWSPLGSFGQLLGSGPGHWLTPASAAPGTIINASMMFDMRAFLMPSFMQSFKLAHERGIRMRPMLGLIFAVIFITLALGLWMNVRLGYQNSARNFEPWFMGVGPKAGTGMAQRLVTGVNADPANILWMIVGAVMIYGTMLGMARLPWFPFHPLGYLMGVTYPMYSLWLSIFIGWLCKVGIERRGGGDAYRKATPFFLGLVLGNVATIVLWLILDGVLGRTHHQFMPH
jgi:hypothetical protein